MLTKVSPHRQYRPKSIDLSLIYHSTCETADSSVHYPMQVKSVCNYFMTRPYFFLCLMSNTEKSAAVEVQCGRTSHSAIVLDVEKL